MTLSLHERIRTDIESAILSGKLAPEERLPVEHELMQVYQCSRMTVNKALSALAAAGLIERRKGAGSFVGRPHAHSMILDVPDLSVEVAKRGHVYGYQLLARKLRVPARGNAEEELLAGGRRLLQLDGLHSADGAPMAVERRLVSLAAVPAIADADLEREPPGTWLLRHVPWTEAETRISAVSADAETARLLKVAAGTACLLVERQTWRGSERITSVRQYFLGTAYHLVARFGSSRS
ncbi:histidine utilization repressor [Nitrospirillum sp. BR 11163]|uniref:histidine utilization repressor n=1 Tax=Nitrospirillum sp. BR 11163 TaxID=3104323 RepID=UPI002AFF5B6D|nr:histidine utilization repressor [Nitrospirillum sp. BR 11163]MEA1672060.1 histidine utilization repressor [Nitrospirillum sp. BR 11163]